MIEASPDTPDADPELAAIEAEWETHEAPAAFTLFGIPNEQTQTTDYAVKIPWVLGLIATRSVDEEVVGIKDLMASHEARIRNGMVAYQRLQVLRSGEFTQADKAAFEDVKTDLGYGLLLKRYTPNVVDATEAQIQQAVRDTIPRLAPLFWSFRIMVATGFRMLSIFAASFCRCAGRAGGSTGRRSPARRLPSLRRGRLDHGPDHPLPRRHVETRSTPRPSP